MQSKNIIKDAILCIGTFFIALAITYPIYIIYSNYANAQVVSISKIFEKSNNISLDNFTYTDGQVISYDRANYTPEQIIIHRWNEISLLNQQAIIAQLTSLGYTEKEEFDPQRITSGVEAR